MHSILVRGATLSTALPLALDALKLVWPREVDAYRASVKGSNYHHTAKRCLMENAWRIMDHGAFVEALRMDFTEADVFVDKESWSCLKELELLQAELDRRLGAPEQAASTDGAIDLVDEATTGGGASR